MAREAGWTYPEIDELLIEDFDWIAARWTKEAGVDVESGEDARMTSTPAVPREVTEEEFRRIAAAEQGFAEKHGGPRNPFL